MKIIVALLTLLLLAGCCKRIYPVQTIVHDTITTTKEVRLRDTVIQAPGGSAGFQLPIMDLTSWPEGQTEQKKDGIAKASVTKTGPNLIVNCDCDTQEIKAELRDSFIRQETKHSEVKTVVQEVKYTPWYTKALAWMGGICFAGGLLMLFLGLRHGGKLF